ncbi:MAG TPA: MopE-related protein [Polyangiales bacterium]|nr:MopE-related protein [Polyangiales bacterium]
MNNDGDPDGGPSGDAAVSDAAANGGVEDAGQISSYTCDGIDPAFFVVDASCGTGYCRTTNLPSSCLEGVVTACAPGLPRGPSDATCDGVDDDCDGKTDENYLSGVTTCGSQACAAQGTLKCVGGREVDSCSVMRTGATDAACDGIDDDCDGKSDEEYIPVASSCGIGACAQSGTITCSGGALVDGCVPNTPSTAIDGEPADGLDDDCDGTVDEHSCDRTPQTFAPGTYANISVPSACSHVTVQLWGGGGASGGKSVSWSAGSSGRGGAGGFASSSLTIGGALTLHVGNGGASGCNAGGTNPGSTSYAGGSGGTTNGAPGGDTLAAGGGNGGNASQGGDGGKGCYGGGGGGQGAQGQPWDPPGGQGGGGGAATVLLMGGTLTVVAGGGGGSGGEAGGWWGVSAGGTGGDGCSGNGGVGSQGACGAAGGGGLCLGTTQHAGTMGVPFGSASIPAGNATGATDDCAAGGAGYAILTFSP